MFQKVVYHRSPDRCEAVKDYGFTHGLRSAPCLHSHRIIWVMGTVFPEWYGDISVPEDIGLSTKATQSCPYVGSSQTL